MADCTQEILWDDVSNVRLVISWRHGVTFNVTLYCNFTRPANYSCTYRKAPKRPYRSMTWPNSLRTLTKGWPSLGIAMYFSNRPTCGLNFIQLKIYGKIYGAFSVAVPTNYIIMKVQIEDHFI